MFFSSLIAGNCYVYETLVIAGFVPVCRHKSCCGAESFKQPLKPQCFIPRVVRWPLLFSNLYISFLTHCLSVRVLERDGLSGSFGIFGLRASLAGMPNVPDSEGMERGGIIFLVLNSIQLLSVPYLSMCRYVISYLLI